jgi:hypothetical protein
MQPLVPPKLQTLLGMQPLVPPKLGLRLLTPLLRLLAMPPMLHRLPLRALRILGPSRGRDKIIIDKLRMLGTKGAPSGGMLGGKTKEIDKIAEDRIEEIGRMRGLKIKMLGMMRSKKKAEAFRINVRRAVRSVRMRVDTAEIRGEICGKKAVMPVSGIARTVKS